MRSVFAVLPYVVGAALGFLLISPPACFGDSAIVRALAGFGVVAVALLMFTMWQMLANLPAEVRLEPTTVPANDGEVQRLCAQFERLGFQRIDPALTVGMSPPALMVGFVHPDVPAYGAVFRTGTLPSKTGFDCLSSFGEDRGGLTTTANPLGTATPASRGALKQAFAGATVALVFERHREALEYLRGRGLEVVRPSAAEFRRNLIASFRRQRHAFTRAPIRGAALTLWRSLTQRTPYIGPIATQEAAQKTIRELLADAPARPAA